MNWDRNYAYACVAFAVGALAGFQAIYERYKDESGTSVNTLPGYGYLLSRGFVPALFFFLLYRTTQLHSYLFGLAIGLGLGTEAVLRSQIQVRSSKPTKDALATENTFVGFFNLFGLVPETVSGIDQHQNGCEAPKDCSAGTLEDT